MVYRDKPTKTQYVLAIVGGLALAAVMIYCCSNIAYGLAGMAEHLRTK